MTSFQQPVGPQADLAELEYITTLHQTSFPELRKDCSISSADISLFLRSRYGLKIHQDRAIDIVLGLGGNTSKKEMSSVRDLDEEHTNIVQNKKSESDEKELNNRHNWSLTNSPEGSDEVHLDLVQALSVILIPTFIKASQDSLEETRKLSSEVVRVRREIAAIENTCSFLDCIENLWTQRHLRLKRELRFLRERQSLLVDPYLLETVRRALISSIQESQTQTVTLDCHFVESLLRAYGEDECADDPELVAQMVECATVSGKPGRGISTFDVEVFSAALTSDIQSWEKGIEDRLSTPFFDVHGFDPISHTTLRSSGIEQVTNTSMIESQEVFEGQTRDEVRHNSDTEEIGWWPVDKLLPTGPSIDSVIDTHQSILFLMANWAYFIFSVTVYMTFINATNYDIFHCGQKYNCILINRIWTWFSLGFLLTFGGMIIMMPISLANDPYKFPWYNALISAMTLIVFTLGPYVFIESYKRSIPHGDQGQLTDLDRIVEAGWFRLAIDIYLAYGLILLIFIPKQLISHNCGQEDKESLGIIGRGFLSSDLLRSAGTKKSATRKIHILLKNAASLHTQSEGLDRGHQSIMSRYIKHEDSHKAVGGILWSFVMLLSNRLLEEHGVWVHSSLAVAQEGQILSFIFLIVVLVYETEAFAAYCDATITEIEDSQPGPIRDLVLWYIPRGDIVRKSSSVGILFAIAVGIVLILVYLPSTVSTVLQLRCGELPTMNDKHFTRKYRYSADTTYYNLGNMIYGLVGAQFLFFLFFGGLVFLCIWPVSRSGMIRFLAWFTALMITILLKYFLTRSFRKKFYSAFYRRRPKAGNISALAMECWHIGLGGGVLIGRLVQFLLASAFWIGRIDVSFLCDDVHIFGYRFDTAPANFRKDLLVHEAHRHPFIDRLGTMYLMRLKHGKEFCSNAGCAWRRLFVQALMPWLLKYRQKVSIKEGNESASEQIVDYEAGSLVL